MMMSEQRVTGSQLSRKGRLKLIALSAVLVASAFQWILMARGNYEVWHFEIAAVELVVALVASFVASIFDGLDERGAQWAAQFVPSREGALYHVLSILPSVAARAALMTACLAIPNATVIPPLVYREEVGFAPVAVLMRFLADIPQGFALCLVARLFVDWLDGLRKKRDGE